MGGDSPLQGISIYEGEDYWHFVTYGLSELYEKESDNKEISGYGMEFTFKLKKDHYEDEEAELKGICNILQTIAKLTFVMEKSLDHMNISILVKNKELISRCYQILLVL